MRRTKRNQGKVFLIKLEKLQNIHSVTTEMQNVSRASLEMMEKF